MLTGSGTAGAYHAGVLRALHEAGVRTDSSPAAAWARSARCLPRSTAARGCGKPPASGRAARRAASIGGGRPFALRPVALVAAGAVLLFPLLLFAFADPRRPRRLAAHARRPRRRGQCADGRVQRPGSSSGSRLAALPLDRSPARAVSRSLVAAAARGRQPGDARPAGAARRRRARGGLLWRLIGSPLSPAQTRRGVRVAAVDPDPRRGAAAAAAGRRAGPPLRRAARRQSRAARLSASCCWSCTTWTRGRTDRRVPEPSSTARDSSARLLGAPSAGARRGSARPVGRRPRSCARRAGGVAGAARRHRAAPRATSPPKDRGAARRTGSATVQAR